MRYHIDTEFIDTGSTIDLISIGIIAEDGRELYLQSIEFETWKASSWVRDNVIPALSYCPHTLKEDNSINIQLSDHQSGQCTFEKSAQAWTGLRGVKLSGGYEIVKKADCPWRTRDQIKDELLNFLAPQWHGKPELHMWCGCYDYIALCQVFGTMMDIPSWFPHYIHDFQQLLDERGISDDELPEQEEGLHNALADASHLKRLWGYIVRNDAWQ